MERLGEMRNGRRERIEKGSRERIEIERKENETNGNRDDNLKRRRRKINIASACCSACSRHCGTPPKTRVPD